MWSHYSLDTRGFAYACRALCVLLLLISATKYGIVRASERLAQDASVPVTSPAPVATSEPPRVIEMRAIPMPELDAEAYLVADVDTGHVVASRNADTVLPIASITKLITALVATNEIPAEAPITITAADRAQTEGTPGRIPSNSTFRAGSLIYPLLMESNNTVAFALARSHTGFIESMNERAAELGMHASSFVEPSGLSPQNSASARDLLSLVRYLAAERKDILAITRTPSFTLESTKKRRIDVPNFNVFLQDPAFLGGKTGYTDDANQTMVSLFSESDRTFAIIVLGTKDRKKDIEALRDWLDASLIN